MGRFKYFNLLSALQLNTSLASANRKDNNHLLACPIKRKNIKHFSVCGIRDTRELCMLLSVDDVGLELMINY